MEKLKIIMTGGGSAGHVTPNLALIPELVKLGYEVQYIGSESGIEKTLVEGEKIPYHSISSGKLRRYFDIKNFSDPFKVIKGLIESYGILRKEKPNVVFSKGGFVSVPVVIGAYLNKIPVIIHESDVTPGLANKISLPYCTKVCVTFPETLQHIKGNKGILTGTPIRKELVKGKKTEGRRLCEFKDTKPVILFIGGSLGSKSINDVIRKNIDAILLKYNVIHICGKGNVEGLLEKKLGYKQFEYVGDGLPDLMAAADIVISRSGANSIFELLTLKKLNILIPLSSKSSRGDQILNANSFEKAGYSLVLQDEELNLQSLLQKLNEIEKNKVKFIAAMEESAVKNGTTAIIQLIEQYARKEPKNKE